MATTPQRSKSKPGLFASLFKGKSNDEDDEGGSAPAASDKAPAATVTAAAKSADAVPMPRSKPADRLDLPTRFSRRPDRAARKIEAGRCNA